MGSFLTEQDCPLSEFSARRAAERCYEEILSAGVSILFRLEEMRTETGVALQAGGAGGTQTSSFSKKIIEKFCGKKRAVTGGYRPAAVVARLDWVSRKRAFNVRNDRAPARTARREPNSVAVWRSGRLRGWAASQVQHGKRAWGIATPLDTWRRGRYVARGGRIGSRGCPVAGRSRDLGLLVALSGNGDDDPWRGILINPFVNDTQHFTMMGRWLCSGFDKIHHDTATSSMQDT